MHKRYDTCDETLRIWHAGANNNIILSFLHLKMYIYSYITDLQFHYIYYLFIINIINLKKYLIKIK